MVIGKKIKVLLQSPWKFTDSPYYKSLRENPPRDIIYESIDEFKLIEHKKRRRLNKLLKKIIKSFIRNLYPSLPNIHSPPKNKEYDMIHCTHCLTNWRGPWVADFESSTQFWVAKNKNNLGKEKIRKILSKKNCKKIMPWNNYVYNSIISLFPELKDKLEVVYPAVPQKRFKKIMHKRKAIIYVARDFYIKGGLIALEVLKKVSKEYDVDIYFVSDESHKFRSKNSKIKFLDLMPQKKLFKYFMKSDIFFYPSLADTFGFASLEAMSFGLPTVSINTQRTPSIKDIVLPGKTGALVDFPKTINFYKVGQAEKELIDKLFDEIGKLLKDEKILKKMSKNCIREIQSGKFSIKERNAKLTKIYKEALDGNKKTPKKII
jgi:glycosyltransferase involved in cell wall biosynthesis